MDPLIALLAALIGYLMGSISFARIVAGRVKPEADITKYVEPLPDSDLVYEDDAVSATLVNLHVGWQYGCLTSILDMIKVIVPLVVFLLLFPDQPYYLIVSVAAMVGHNWPIYYHFNGGRGESVFYGSMLVIDPLGAVVCNIAAVILGVLIGQVHMVRWGGMALLIPWLWWRTNDPYIVAYGVFMNVVFWIAMRGDLRQYREIYRSGALRSQEDWSDFLDMSRELGRFMDRYSIPALIGRLTGRGKSAG
jgi:glycerol-3-phosphate acyltransferase PlsY